MRQARRRGYPVTPVTRFTECLRIQTSRTSVSSPVNQTVLVTGILTVIGRTEKLKTTVLFGNRTVIELRLDWDDYSDGRLANPELIPEEKLVVIDLR